jgi:septal ring factor EnvC (AmiA/AmiB activator)
MSDAEIRQLRKTLHEAQDQLQIAQEQIRKLEAELAISEIRCSEALEQALVRQEGPLSKALSSAKRSIRS